MSRPTTKNDQIELEQKLSSLRRAMCKLISQATQDTNVRYENNRLVKCWEIKKCGKTECPSYENKNLRCWQVAGTFCGGQVQGAFAQKYGNCKECEVFKSASTDTMDAIGEHFNNLLHMLDEKVKKVEALNHELLVVEGLILKAASAPSVRYENPQLIRCWELLNCIKIDCPSYKNKNLRCWQVVGTFCGGKVEGQFARKLGDCQKCKVFQVAGRSEASAIGEQFNNMMFLLELKKKKVDTLNEELLKAMEHLDKKNKEVLKLTITDNLTGLFTRGYLFNSLEREVARNKRYKHPLSLFVIDIDGFKNYNDTYGHIEGDTLLKKFGEIIKSCVRNTDISCRFGGDEFVIILPETDQTTAEITAERIRKTIGEQAFYPGEGENVASINKTVSIGVYTVTFADELPEKLIERADDAMYQAKQKDGNKVVTFTE